jgi:hypothetical protein
MPSDTDNLKMLTDEHLILQFRTITTMLNVLHEIPVGGTRSMVVEETSVPKGQEEKLRLLGALSTVLVRNYEIVAVVSSDSGGMLGRQEVIGCVFSPNLLELTSSNPQLDSSTAKPLNPDPIAIRVTP